MKRTFRTGFGRLTAPMLTQATAAGDLVAKHGDPIAKAAAEWSAAPAAKPWLFAKITSSTAISGTTNRWEYSWEEVSFSSTLGLVTRAYTSTNAGKAYNLCEFVNNGTGYEGPGWDLATSPTGFSIQPIRECVVQLWPVELDGTGSARWVFFAANVLDGVCPA